MVLHKAGVHRSLYSFKDTNNHKNECELTKNSRLESAGLEDNEEPRAHAGVWRAVRSPQLMELSLGLPL